MDAVSDWVALQRRVGAVPRTSAEYTTNLYATGDQFEAWCRTGPVQARETPGALLLLRGDRDFHHVHHVAADHAALMRALEGLPNGVYVTDLVGRDAGLAPLCAIYHDAGFRHHSFLIRMGRAQSPSGSGSASSAGDAEPATVGDVAAIAAFLERLLDRFTEQLPGEAELGEAARAGRLLVVRRGTGIAGMLMFDVRGRAAHLRYWHVDRDARGAGVGRRLMESFLARCAQMRQIALWVIGDNDRSIAIYRHYGFAADGLVDRIMLCNKDVPL